MVSRLAAITLFLCFLGNHQLFSQNSAGFRQKKIHAAQPTHQLDSLSIQPLSFSIATIDGQPLDQAFFSLDALNALLRLRLPETMQGDSLVVRYRVFPLRLTAPYFHRNASMLFDEQASKTAWPLSPAAGTPDQGVLRVSGLQSSGSITRGITIGNRQDLSLQSAMNLQLSGNISQDIEINAVISDQDIPFQPDGTTRQLQDFDKVYITISGLGGQLTAGDFDLDRPKSHFMHFQRRAQGAMAGYKTQAHAAGLMGGAQVQLTAAGAIAKGKYVKNQLRAMEGNQGPYKLSGANNESFIIVLAGSERVFIDGALQTRGMDHDYIIDYNMAEITFTSRRLITRETRIVVEFEYAGRYFAQSVLYAASNIQTDRTLLTINFFSEQDHKNQSLFQELTNDRIKKMAGVGDSLHLAFDWNVDSTGFRNDRVMYLITDSLGFDSVFVFSTNPQRAVYSLGFSFVGQGNGNYIQVSSAANGRVFQWVAPVNGTRQGTHDPVFQLVTPKKKQMLSLGADYKINNRTAASMEFAMSNNDLNLFSKSDSNDDLGFGLVFRLNSKTPLTGSANGGWSLLISGAHEFVSKHFTPVERFRPVEFDRDWNLTNFSSPAAENNTTLSFQLESAQNGNARYQFRSFQKGPSFSGFMNMAEARLLLGRVKVTFDGSLLNSSGLQQTDFYRHRAGISRPLFFLVAGIEHQMENNRRTPTNSDQLHAASAAFDEWHFFVSNSDTAINRIRLFHKIRTDRKPYLNTFVNQGKAREFGMSYEFLKNPNQRFTINVALRSLNIETQTPENSVVGRLNYSSRWWKGVVVSSLFYETGSGMERKREYIYIEVPPGQGVYTWVDYNANGIMELDEFELAQFPDQANFVRVFIPTDHFIRVFSNTYSHTITIDPRIVWRETKGIKGFLARFRNQTSFRIDQKNQGNAMAAYFLPFGANLQDTLLVGLNASFRNSLFFNRTGKVFFAELTWLDNRNKMLLSNGFESRVLQSAALRTRWNINRSYSLEMQIGMSERMNRAEFFMNRNYSIKSVSIEPVINYQLDNQWRLSLQGGYSTKENVLMSSGERSQIKKGGLEFRYSIPAKGNLSARYQLNFIDYPFSANTPLAFEMLEGLNAGLNHVLNFTWQQTLNAWLQLSVSYHGRKTPGTPPVHSGSMQVRALF